MKPRYRPVSGPDLPRIDRLGADQDFTVTGVIAGARVPFGSCVVRLECRSAGVSFGVNARCTTSPEEPRPTAATPLGQQRPTGAPEVGADGPRTPPNMPQSPDETGNPDRGETCPERTGHHRRRTRAGPGTAGAERARDRAPPAPNVRGSGARQNQTRRATCPRDRPPFPGRSAAAARGAHRPGFPTSRGRRPRATAPRCRAGPTGSTCRRTRGWRDRRRIRR